MSCRQRTESEPECWRLCELTTQFIAKQQVVERNQYDPVRHSNHADEKDPGDQTTNQLHQPYCVVRLSLRFSQRSWNQCRENCSQRGESIKPIIEDRKRCG